jgi:predicted DNA-binding transcriptional regulator AlpA
MTQRVFRIADLATTKKKAGLLPVSPATVWRWVQQGRFPKPFKLGDHVTVWSAEAVEAFIEKRAGGPSQ